MMVSDKHQFVFISTPKAGTHTMYRFLERQFGIEPPKVGNFHPTKTPARAGGYFRFTTCRNPYRRTVGTWWTFINRPYLFKDWDKAIIERIGTFKGFLDWVLHTPAGKRPPWTGPPLRSQSLWHARLYPLAAILHIENVSDEYAKLPWVKERLFIQPYSSRNRPVIILQYDWREHYDDEVAAMVQELAGRDFDAFGYSLDWRKAG